MYLIMLIINNIVAMTTGEIKKKWQKWDEGTIDSYRLQFRVIDLNEDGLIDFHELYEFTHNEHRLLLIIQLSCFRCHALDEIGDTSSTEDRKRYFREVDVDQSEGVDFEEYLEVCSI